ncbi:hypothetical protein EG329_002520, partial [Mollisiaceae sp. DMI_Dod_QoI]
MGRWGELLFEGDNDLDEAPYISRDAGIELYSYEVESNPEYDLGGKGLEATRAHLNNGVLHRLFVDYSTKPLKNGWSTKELRLVFLAALAMRVGATIEHDFMEVLNAIIREMAVARKNSLLIFDTGFRGPMKDQFETALMYYKNDGTPYDFYAIRCKGQGCAKSKDELDETKGEKLMKCGKC